MRIAKLYPLLVSAVILLSGCGGDQYSIEKQFYKTQKMAEKIFINPNATPPKQVENVVNALEGFIKKYPKVNLSVQAEFTIARLYIVKEEFDKAIKQLKEVIAKYKKFDNVCAEAVFLIGNTYEIEDKWNQALEQYKKVMSDYPVTIRGFEAPIYIAEHYKLKYKPDLMIASLREAIGHYKALAEKYPNSAVALKAQGLIGQCHLGLKEWQEAVATYYNIIQSYKDKIRVDQVLFEIAQIYKKELKDPLKAKEVLERMVKDYPDSRLKARALNLLKEQDKK